jgi:hypothetical protein
MYVANPFFVKINADVLLRNKIPKFWPGSVPRQEQAFALWLSEAKTL